MNPQEPYVSVVEPVSPAIEQVKTVLFRPFDLGRWFIIGLCAWLASLGHFGSGNGGGGGRGRSGGPFQSVPDQVRHGFEDGREFIGSHPWVFPVAMAAFVAMLALWLVVMWLSSRGQFMFLDCVAQNKAEVRNPWHRFRTHAYSLFLFRIVLVVLWSLAALAFIIPAAVTVYVVKMTLGSTALSVLGIVAFALSFIAVMIVFGVVAVFTRDFVVPIMYLRALSCRQAWGVLLDLLGVNKLRFVLYLLFQIVISVVITMIVIALSCVTCCIAGCFFMIPYVGTVALLPVIMFRRAYSLFYLAQYGPELNVFPPASPPET